MGWNPTIPYNRLRRLIPEPSAAPDGAREDIDASINAARGPNYAPAEAMTGSPGAVLRDLVQEATAQSAPAPSPPVVSREPNIERMPTVDLPVRNSAVNLPSVAGGIVDRMQPATIAPEPAPPISRMAARPDFVGDTKREAVADPNLRRPAVIDQTGMAPALYDWVNSDTPMPTKPQPRQIERGGVGGTLKSVLRGALQGLAIGGRQGGIQGIGGAIAGGLQGAISPQSVENVNNEFFRMPKYERDKAEAEADIARKEQIIERIASRTGLDPTTGAVTPEMEIKREQMRGLVEQRLGQSESRHMNAETHRLNIQEKIRHNTATEGEKQLNDFWTRFPGKATPSQLAQAAGRPYLAGYVPPAKATSAAPRFVPETGGRMMWDTAQGKMVPTPGSEALPPQRNPDESTPHQRFEETRQVRQDVDRNVSEARKEMQIFEAAKKKVGAAAAKYSALKQAADSKGLYKGRFIDDSEVDEAEAAYNDAQAEFQGARPTHRYVRLSPDGTAVTFDQAAADADRGVSSKSQTINQSEYRQQVAKHGQAKVDEWLAKKGITVQ